VEYSRSRYPSFDSITVHKEMLHIWRTAYLGLGATPTNGVNPDILGQDVTALVQRHVLHELSSSQYMSAVDDRTDRRDRES
jgi:hypothetical protein